VNKKITEILGKPIVRKALIVLLYGVSLNFLVVPILLGLIYGAEYGWHYFFNISIGILYFGFTIGSFILYNSEKNGERNLLIAKNKVERAEKFADRGRVKELNIAEQNYYNVEQENLKRIDLKELCDRMSIFFRALALLFAMYVFFNYFGTNEKLIESKTSDLANQIELIKTSNDSLVLSNKIQTQNFTSQLNRQFNVIEALEGRILEIELKRKGPKQSNK